MSSTDLIPYDPELLDPDMLLDEHHPANDVYMQGMELTQKRIVEQSKRMKPKHVEVVKLRHTGMTNVEIAEKLDYTPQTVGTINHRDDAKRLHALLCYYQQAIDGPNQAQRRNMLWRMAIDCEEERPTVAKECIAELNRMDDSDNKLDMLKQGNDNTVNIIINNETLPRGALD